jgi:HAD superfamily hydrolase (TIGR01509 family)
MSALELVVFDCDGVLVDSETISNEVLAEMLSSDGLPTTLAQSRSRYQGLLLEDIRVRAQDQLGRALPTDWMENYELARGEAFLRSLKPIDGAAAAIEQIRGAGLKACVASQGKFEKIRLSLEITGLAHLFADEEVFSAYMVARGKPHPDLFLHAASRMRAEPAACVVIEDTPSGVQGAVAAGMSVLGYEADSDAAALRAAGARTFRSLLELPGLLGIA